MSHAAVFAAVFVALYAAHHVGDHWLQRSAEARGKGADGWHGRTLCGRHVATLTLAKVAALAVTAGALHLPLSIPAVTIALAVDAVTHYIADRRKPLARIAEWADKGEFWRLGDGGAAPAGTGAYALDQSWHVAWLWVAALIVAAGS